MAKRIFLFLLTNFLVIVVVGTLINLLGITPYLTGKGLDFKTLAIFCLVWGMGGAFISLALSKSIAKWTMGLQMIDPKTSDPQARAVVEAVHRMASQAGLPQMPEVAFFRSPELNAFATGPTRSNSLVAVSSGLLQRMPSPEVEAVLGHEVTHIANGDMVTMTLLQGVINAFVMFAARVIALVLNRGQERENSTGFAYWITVMLLEAVFMLLGSLVVARFSRQREFRADAGGARLSTPQQMIASLETLKKTLEIQDPRTDIPAFRALKISSRDGWLRYFASHPPLEERIARLKKRYSL